MSGLSGPDPEDRSSPDGRRSEQGIRVDPDAGAELSPRRAVISVLVDHEPGVLAEVSGLFSRRQFNIESLTVGPTTDDDHARITLVVEEPEPGIEQVEKQLARLVDVIAVSEIAGPAAERELALVKVDGDRPERVRAVTEMVHGTVVDANPEAITVEVTGTSAAVDRAIDALDRFPVREVARTGTTSLARGPEPTTDAESERREELHE